ncbi:hypothetical protein [Mycobacterium sp. 94-17]|uniref:hypothetical protein n=1 Tax=Mycobacterium sp. 94-17 TaxID=2986147 RepID=UPI002D1E6E54|nr:hypothetical protein [Mycobacterium sp. 94-17]MEB4208403.1 hypothetical protein [Mycobacterium sp. 94-17]
MTAGLIALAGLMTAGVAVANADEVEVNDIRYSSEAGCVADGPNVELEYNDHLYNQFYCYQGGDGFWHLVLHN